MDSTHKGPVIQIAVPFKDIIMQYAWTMNVFAGKRSIYIVTLHERNGVSNHRHIDCLFKSLSKLTTKQTPKLDIYMYIYIHTYINIYIYIYISASLVLRGGGDPVLLSSCLHIYPFLKFGSTCSCPGISFRKSSVAATYPMNSSTFHTYFIVKLSCLPEQK